MNAFCQSEEFNQFHPHEALSSLILKSQTVRKYIAELQNHYHIEFDIDKAADSIIANFSNIQKNNHYEIQVINGPFDADKLDYIFRDAHYSGIPVGLDLDRLWASCKVSETESGEHVLTLHQASVAPLEQILFSKINLFSIVYQHPKVRAAEKMFQAVVEEAKAKDDTIYFNVSGRKLNLNRSTDYLWLTDEAFFAEALHRKQEDDLHKKLHNIRYRRFLVRALTISNDTIDNDCSDGFLQLRKLNQKGPETYNARRNVAREIIEAAGLQGKIDDGDVWVDFPADPSFGEADRTFVRTAADSLRPLSVIFPVHYWTEMYRNYKWRGHVFCSQQHQQKIHEAALEVFKDKYQVRFKKSAGETSHVEKPKSTAIKGN
jgi:HD superfamily phosphohydrolase